MVVAGFDCSTSCSGWSIFDGDRLVAYGKIKPPAEKEWDARLLFQWQYFCKIMDKYKPEIICYEQPPLKDGKITLLKLGAVQGMIMALCAQYNSRIEFLSPPIWRRAVGLFDGTREGLKRDNLKKESIERANQLFGLSLNFFSLGSKRNDDDVSDAVLIAYSYVKRSVNDGE